MKVWKNPPIQDGEDDRKKAPSKNLLNNYKSKAYITLPGALYTPPEPEALLLGFDSSAAPRFLQVACLLEHSPPHPP